MYGWIQEGLMGNDDLGFAMDVVQLHGDYGL
jgi:hypothetical protein